MRAPARFRRGRIPFARLLGLLALAPGLAAAGALPPEPPPRGTVAATEASDRMLSDLWTELERRPFSLAGWEQRARAAAFALSTSDRPALLEAVRDRSRLPAERAAAAELLWRLAVLAGEAPPTLASAELGFLRGTARGGLAGAGLPLAARRALVELGDWSDDLALVRAFEAAHDAEQRAELARCLGALRRPGALVDLARLAVPARGRDRSDRLPELATAALSSALHGMPPIEANRRAELVELLLTALDTPFAGAELVERVAGLLGTLGGARALGRLESLAREGRESATRALVRSPAGRSVLVELLSDPTLGEAGRLASAAALAGSTEPETRAHGRRSLERIAARGVEPRIRFRAALALELTAR